MKRTKIVITLGPATIGQEKIEKLIQIGVDVFRLNFSHGDHVSHQKNIEDIRVVSKRVDKSPAILQDISGPKVRVGEIEGILDLKCGDTLKLCKEKDIKDRNSLSLSYPAIIDLVKEGEEVYFADGTLRTIVKKKSDNCLALELLTNGKLTSRKGVNVPHTKLDISAITKKDIEDLKFGAKMGVDIVALSFVQKRDDVLKAKEILKNEGANPLVVSKIEMSASINNLDEILEVSDGVMVARGDLGAEMGVEKVPVLQKEIIKKANDLGIPVITATQMLMSMVNSPFPTRAEISDIANAVLDGTDAVMLSDETTIGKFPFEAVEVLKKSIIEAEKTYPYNKDFEANTIDAIAMSACKLSSVLNQDAIVVFTTTGFTAKSIAKYRPKTNIIAITHSQEVRRQLSLVWGIDQVFVAEASPSTSTLIYDFIREARKFDLIKEDSSFIITMGYIVGKQGSTNMIRVLDKYGIQKIENRYLKS